MGAHAANGGAQGLGGHGPQPTGIGGHRGLHVVVEEQQQLAAGLLGGPVVEQAPVERLIQEQDTEAAAGALAPVGEEGGSGLQAGAVVHHLPLQLQIPFAGLHSGQAALQQIGAIAGEHHHAQAAAAGGRPAEAETARWLGFDGNGPLPEAAEMVREQGRSGGGGGGCGGWGCGGAAVHQHGIERRDAGAPLQGR